MKQLRSVQFYLGCLAGVFFGLIFPVIFIILDLKDLEQNYTLKNIVYVIESQAIYEFSIYAFPIVFVIIFQSLLFVLKSKREIQEANEKVLIEQKRSLMNSKMASIGEMASAIAHEINNPLAIINLSAKTFEKQVKRNNNTPKLDDSTELLSSIYQSVTRISKIIETMKILSKAGSYKEKDIIALKDILHNVIDKKNNVLLENNITLKNEINLEQVYCNSEDLEQAIKSVLENSIDELCSKEFKQSERWIHIYAEVINDVVKLKIKDSGAGINDEIVQSMFDPFFSTKDVNEGSGLGLSFARQILLFSNGDIYYNEESNNTEFVLEIPSKKPLSSSE